MNVPAFGAGNHHAFGDENSADMLMFIPQSAAADSTKLIGRTMASGRQSPAPPSTPPSKFAPLPSTFMSGLVYPDFAPITSGNTLSFDDFLGFSPANAWRTGPAVGIPTVGFTATGATPAWRRSGLDVSLPSVSVFADNSLTSTSMSLFGGSLDLIGDM